VETTRRLFRISSVSVRMASAPISSIQLVAARPKRAPHALRSVRMNSAFGSGCGAATMTGPLMLSRAINHCMARTKSAW